MAQNEVKIVFKGEGDLLNQIKKLDTATKSLVNAQAKLVQQGKLVKSDAQKNASALKRIEIQLEAVNFDYKKVGISTKLWNSALKGSAVDLQRVRNQLKKYNLEQGRADISTRILGGTFAVLRSKLLLFNFAMGLGIRQLGKFGSQASQVESMKMAFITLAGETENASVALSKLKEATNNTMSEFDLFQQANNAMILGVSDNSDTMAEMFDIAQRLGRALGRDTASSVESLITGIGRQSRLMLDNIGIIVKSEEAYKKFAEANNTTADALTDAQKKQAFLEATMESARKKVKSIGDEVLTSKDAYDQLTTATTELATATGEFLQPAIVKSSGFFTKAIKSITEYTRILTNSRKAITEHTSLQEQEEIVKSRIIRLETILQRLKKGDSLDKATEIKNSEKLMQLHIQLGDIQTELAIATKESIKIKKESSKAEENLTKEAEERAKRESEAIKNKNILLKFSEEKINAIIKESNETRKAVFGDTIGFQLAQLNILEGAFLKHHGHTLESEQFFADERLRIQTEAFEKNTLLWDSFSAGYDQFVGTLVDTEMSGKERREKIWEATKNGFVTFLATMIKEQIKNAIINETIAKTAQATSVKSSKVTGQLIASAYATSASLASTSTFGGAAVAGQAAVATSVTATKALAKMEDGGLIGGKRHSQGGTIVEAERGEFVMSRNAVQSIGVETLNQMNASGAMGNNISVNITGGVVDESYVNNELIPALNKATSLGNKINA